MNWTWWKAALIRAIKTVAQTAVAFIGVGSTIGDIDWLHVLSVSCVAGILSLLTSIAGLPEVEQAKMLKENEDCYKMMVNENNHLREELYGDISDDDDSEDRTEIVDPVSEEIIPQE